MVRLSKLIWRILHSRKINLRIYWTVLKGLSFPYSWIPESSEMRLKSVAISLSSYNCEEWIAETIKSILQQKHLNWTLFIHDDASEDKTTEIIRRFSKSDSRIQFFSNTRTKGPYHNHNSARKKAIDLGYFNFFTVIDHDDIAHPSWLSRNIQIIDNSKAVGVRPINSRE